MTLTHRFGISSALVVAFMLTVPAGAAAQRGGRGGAGGQASNLPTEPVAVPRPEVSGPVTGPGVWYESVQSLPIGHSLASYGYEALEYFVSGTAAGEPYKTRFVIRKPVDDGDFSGLVLAEAMHPSGSTHLFEFTSVYSADRGNISVEIVVSGLDNLTDTNAERYAGFGVSGAQVPEVLAQVGAFLREDPDSPLAAIGVRKMILAGTSATAGILIQFLPAHDVLRTPSMGPIFDGYLAHSNGGAIPQVDAPLIQVPTMLEVGTPRFGGGPAAPTRQDSDEPGNQYRLYEFPGMGHVDTRDGVRTQPNPCVNPTSQFPLQAYVAVAMNHLFRWVDEGVVPPRANRILLDRNVANDGSYMALDEHGNPLGGIRNPYVDLPVAQYSTPNEAAETLPTNPSAYIAAAGVAGSRQMCGLGAYQIVFSREKLRELYGSKQEYVRRVEASLDALEAAGWSLPIYRDMILSDARAIVF